MSFSVKISTEKVLLPFCKKPVSFITQRQVISRKSTYYISWHTYIVNVVIFSPSWNFHVLECWHFARDYFHNFAHPWIHSIHYNSWLNAINVRENFVKKNFQLAKISKFPLCRNTHIHSMWCTSTYKHCYTNCSTICFSCIVKHSFLLANIVFRHQKAQSFWNAPKRQCKTYPMHTHLL